MKAGAEELIRELWILRGDWGVSHPRFARCASALYEVHQGAEFRKSHWTRRAVVVTRVLRGLGLAGVQLQWSRPLERRRSIGARAHVAAGRLLAHARRKGPPRAL